MSRDHMLLVFCEWFPILDVLDIDLYDGICSTRASLDYVPYDFLVPVCTDFCYLLLFILSL